MKIPYSTINQIDFAIYLPALQSFYTGGVIKKASRSLPKGLTIDDLNFFKSGSKLFNLDAALYSSGVVGNLNNYKPCMVTNRKRGKAQNTLVMGDSGGYQIATQNLIPSPKKQEDIYHWLVANCDLAMTLDVPTFPMYEGTSIHYESLDDCLDKTLEYLERFKSLGAEKEFFLNVLQGEGTKDADTWYNAVKHFNFYGWAIAGPQKHSIKHVLHRIIALIEDEKFDCDETWIHFLGIGDLKTAILLTTLRNALRDKFQNCSINISYDTSTPLYLAGTKLTISEQPIISPTQLTIPNAKIDKTSWVGSRQKFPFGFSEISKYLTKGHIIRHHPTKEDGPDDLSYMLMANHNIQVHINAVVLVNNILTSGKPRNHLAQVLPRNLLEAQDTIIDILSQPTMEKARNKLWQQNTQDVLDDGYNNNKDYSKK